MSTCEEQLAELKIYYIQLLDRSTKQLVDKQNEIERLQKELRQLKALVRAKPTVQSKPAQRSKPAPRPKPTVQSKPVKDTSDDEDHENKKISKQTNDYDVNELDHEIQYLDTSEEDTGAVDVKNIVKQRKRKRSKAKKSDLGSDDFKRSKKDLLEEMIVVYNMIDNVGWVYEAREAILNHKHVENNQKNLTYYAETNNGAGYRSKIYGEDINNMTDLTVLDIRINDISEAMLYLKQHIDAKNIIDLTKVEDILYRNIDWEEGDVRCQLNEGLAWETLEHSSWRLMTDTDRQRVFHITQTTTTESDVDIDIKHLSTDDESSSESEHEHDDDEEHEEHEESSASVNMDDRMAEMLSKLKF